MFVNVLIEASGNSSSNRTTLFWYIYATDYCQIPDTIILYSTVELYAEHKICATETRSWIVWCATVLINNDLDEDHKSIVKNYENTNLTTKIKYVKDSDVPAVEF